MQTFFGTFFLKGRILAETTVSALAESYDLFIIEDEETPLGAGPAGGTNYYIFAVCMVIVAAIIAIASVWFTRRAIFRRRLLELRSKSGNTNTKVPFLIRNIKSEIVELETELSAVML